MPFFATPSFPEGYAGLNSQKVVETYKNIQEIPIQIITKSDSKLQLFGLT